MNPSTVCIHLLPAKEAPVAVILRRKPSRTWHILKWNLARPLRIEIPGGRYHVTARGNDRGLIFDCACGNLRRWRVIAIIPPRGKRSAGLHAA